MRLDGHADHGSEAGGLGDGSLGGVSDLASHRQREPDDDQLDFFVAGDPGDLVEVAAARLRAVDDGQR